MLLSLGEEGAIGAGAIDLSVLLPVLTGATSFIGLLFGYLILPVWVAYLLKDRVGNVAELVSRFLRQALVQLLGGQT